MKVNAFHIITSPVKTNTFFYTILKFLLYFHNSSKLFSLPFYVNGFSKYFIQYLEKATCLYIVVKLGIWNFFGELKALKNPVTRAVVDCLLIMHTSLDEVRSYALSRFKSGLVFVEIYYCGNLWQWSTVFCVFVKSTYFKTFDVIINIAA